MSKRALTWPNTACINEESVRSCTVLRNRSWNLRKWDMDPRIRQSWHCKRPISRRRHAVCHWFCHQVLHHDIAGHSADRKEVSYNTSIRSLAVHTLRFITIFIKWYICFLFFIDQSIYLTYHIRFDEFYR